MYDVIIFWKNKKKIVKNSNKNRNSKTKKAFGLKKYFKNLKILCYMGQFKLDKTSQVRFNFDSLN